MLVNKKFKNLVLSGGGLKGALTIGGLKELEKDGLLDGIRNVLGTSIGSFLGLLWILGYSGEDMERIFCEVDFNKYRKVSIRSLLSNFGLETGDEIIKFFKAIIKYKTGNSEITFKELEEKYGKSLIISAVQLNPTKTYYFCKENEPDMPVITAIRLSISVPIYFTPLKWKGKYYLDGSTIDHFHGNYFESEEPTLYLLIYTRRLCDKTEDELVNFESYLKFMFLSIFDFIQGGQFDDISLNPAVSNIEYEYPHLEFLDSNINANDIKSMVLEGVNETRKYLDKVKRVDEFINLKKMKNSLNIIKKWKDLRKIIEN